MYALISLQMIQFILYLSPYFQVFTGKYLLQNKVLALLYDPLFWQVLELFDNDNVFQSFEQIYIFPQVISNKDTLCILGFVLSDYVPFVMV